MLSSIVMHRNCRELDVLINEIVWGGQTAVFLLLPFLTLTVYSYAVEPHQKTTPTAKIKWFSHGCYISHLQELR